MQRKIIAGIIVGVLAGVIDIIPMIYQGLPLNANLSAFTMWVVVGALNGMISVKIPGILKGIIISFMVLLPCAFIIGWSEPMTLIPISIMTLVLGTIVGFIVDRI